MTSLKKISKILLIESRNRMTIQLILNCTVYVRINSFYIKNKIPFQIPEMNTSSQNHNPSLNSAESKSTPTWNNTFNTVFSAVLLSVVRQREHKSKEAFDDVDSFSGDTGSLGDSLSGTSEVSETVELRGYSHSRLVRARDVAL